MNSVILIAEVVTDLLWQILAKWGLNPQVVTPTPEKRSSRTLAFQSQAAFR